MSIPALVLEWLAKEDEESLRTRLFEAVQLAIVDGQVDGAHHKMWVIDQMLRSLLGPAYEHVIAEYERPTEPGECDNDWDRGIPP